MNITLLDYGAGNVRSVRNAIKKLGFTVTDAKTPADILAAEKLIFPGVGSFGSAMQRLHQYGYVEPLLEYLRADRPFLGICLGLQTLFEGSEEALGVAGLGIIKGQVRRFTETTLSVPQIGWNGINIRKPSRLLAGFTEEKLYFVHSYRAAIEAGNEDWVLTTTNYGEEFISSVQKGNVAACQFHPEKSGAGRACDPQKLSGGRGSFRCQPHGDRPPRRGNTDRQTDHRLPRCAQQRQRRSGGDQGRPVRCPRSQGEVRNLGKPVELARRYYEEGADEITFLNITGFRDFPMKDQPMLEVLQRTSEQVFVPLTIGGGIREFTDSEGKHYSALDVASEYFRSGADKISIGSDAVLIAEEYLKTGKKSGTSSIEQISAVYGNQAVVISVDPRRVYVKSPADTPRHTIKTKFPGPNGEEYCWYQCTIKGGREGREVDALELATSCEALGAGEILLNCIDKDGTNSGFDLELINQVRQAVSIPVIASSGAGKVEHFSEVFEETGAEAALAAGIFHRQEVPISAVKAHLREKGIETR